MSKETPDHHDAELVWKVYDLRREPVMRQSRDAITTKFWPKSYEELVAVTKWDHPLNQAYRQTSSYWEMVYGMAARGIVNADYLIENNGEGLFLYAKVLPFLEQLRKEINPLAFKNAEWIATQCEEGRKRFAIIQGRVKKMAESMAK
ncbi:MAG TPA: hypothetical protein VEK08_22940 [Planctomycetota bacterium]|nr:hypothetical protein [Planctomycetota bacterium]